jgi:hypothetical protein
MAKTWEDVSKAAMQILGPQGKIPDETNGTTQRAAAASQKSWADFEAARKSLKDALEAHKEKAANFLGSWEAFVDDVSKDDLGLDPKKNKEDEKKIAAARKLLVGYLNDVVLQPARKLIGDLKKLDSAVKVLMDA